MKLAFILLLGCIVICLTGTSAKPSKLNHESFQITILEKRTVYEQEVDLDEEHNLITVHVPSHNNLQETYFVTDTKEHLTVRLAPEQRMCFLKRNDPDELPSAEVWRKNKDSVIDDAESTTQRRSYMVAGALSAWEKRDLPPSIQKMCAGLNLVWIEPMNDEVPIDTTYINHTRPDGKLQKRYVEFCVDKAQKCVVFHNCCYHVMTCMNGEDAICIKKQHIYEDVRCCTPCCLDFVVPDHSFTPDCRNDFTKEEVCPGYDFV